MGGHCSDKMERFGFYFDDRKALAAYSKPKVVLVWADFRGACDNSIQELLEGLKAKPYKPKLTRS